MLDRLKMCNLESLEIRRLINDMVFVYKILNNHVDLNPDEFFSLRATTICTRGHSLRIYPNQFKRMNTSHFFSSRIVNVWNDLSETTVSSFSLSVFKKRLVKENSDVLLKYIRGRALRGF